MGCETSIELPPNYVIVNALCNTKLYDTFKVKKANCSEFEVMKQYNSIGRRLADRIIFQKEIEKISNLTHPYLLKPTLIIEINNNLIVTRPYMSMNLINFANTTKYTSKMQLKIIRDVVVGVSYLHKNGFVHGNIKPSNVLLSEDCSKCVITDYCQNIIYKSYRSGIPYYRNNYNYLSPEALLGKEVSDKSDIWSLGMIIYFIIERKDLMRNNKEKKEALKNLDSLFEGITVFQSMGVFLKKVFIYDPNERMNIDGLIEEIKKNEFIKVPKDFNFNKMGDESEETYEVPKTSESKETVEEKDEVIESKFENKIPKGNFNIMVNEMKKAEETEETLEKEDEEETLEKEVEVIDRNFENKIPKMFDNAEETKSNNNNKRIDNIKMIDNYIQSLNPEKDTLIDFYDKNLSDEDVSYLCDKLSSLPFITTINISNNNYSDLGVSKLSCVLKESKNIKSINISGNNISNEFYFNRSVDFNEICFNISFSNLTEIKMNRDENFIKLANTLCSLPQLINIEVSKNDISDFSFKNFTNVMRSLSQIESLDFSCILYYSIGIGNLITDDGFIYFIDNITTINTLRNNKITEKSIQKLIDNLSICKNLKSVEVLYNNISDVNRWVEKLFDAL